MSREKNAEVGLRTHSRKMVWWVVCWTVFITRVANGKTCFGDSHTRPPESDSHWFWFLGPSVVIDAEGVQNIEQGGEEGEERSCSVDVVLVYVLVFRHNSGVCLQDGGTHVQDACGSMVQTV